MGLLCTRWATLIDFERLRVFMEVMKMFLESLKKERKKKGRCREKKYEHHYATDIKVLQK